MRGMKRGYRRLPHLSPFGGVFEGEAGEFGGFFCGELVGGGGAGVGISHLHQTGAVSGEFGDDHGNVARVTG
jgi:hypothetical protein